MWELLGWCFFGSTADFSPSRGGKENNSQPGLGLVLARFPLGLLLLLRLLALVVWCVLYLYLCVCVCLCVCMPLSMRVDCLLACLGTASELPPAKCLGPPTA